MRRLLAAATVMVASSTAGLMACDGDSGSLSAFCATAERFAADNPAAVFDRYDPSDPAAAATLLRDAAGRLADWADEAPGEIDDDVDTVATAATTLASQFEALASGEVTDEEASAFDVAEVEAASTRLLEFTRANCDVDLEPPPP